MAELSVYEVIRRPLITEKATRLSEELTQYVFEVAPNANKVQIKAAVETIFDTEVKRVNTINMPAKRGRRGRKWYIRAQSYKKAIVTLMPGKTINLFNV